MPRFLRTTTPTNRPSSDSISLRSPRNGSSCKSLSMISPASGIFKRQEDWQKDEDPPVALLVRSKDLVVATGGVEKESLGMDLYRLTVPMSMAEDLTDSLDNQGVSWTEE